MVSPKKEIIKELMIKVRQNLELPMNVHRHLSLPSICTSVDMREQQKQDRKETTGIRKNRRNKLVFENY